MNSEGYTVCPVKAVEENDIESNLNCNNNSNNNENSLTHMPQPVATLDGDLRNGCCGDSETYNFTANQATPSASSCIFYSLSPTYYEGRMVNHGTAEPHETLPKYETRMTFRSTEEVESADITRVSTRDNVTVTDSKETTILACGTNTDLEPCVTVLGHDVNEYCSIESAISDYDDVVMSYRKANLETISDEVSAQGVNAAHHLNTESAIIDYISADASYPNDNLDGITDLESRDEISAHDVNEAHHLKTESAISDYIDAVTSYPKANVDAITGVESRDEISAQDNVIGAQCDTKSAPSDSNDAVASNCSEKVNYAVGSALRKTVAQSERDTFILSKDATWNALDAEYAKVSIIDSRVVIDDILISEKYDITLNGEESGEVVSDLDDDKSLGGRDDGKFMSGEDACMNESESDNIMSDSENGNIMSDVEDVKILSCVEYEKFRSGVEEDKTMSDIEEDRIVKGIELESDVEDDKIMSGVEDDRIMTDVEDDNIMNDPENDKVMIGIDEDKIMSDLEQDKMRDVIEHNKIMSGVEDEKIMSGVKDDKIMNGVSEYKIISYIKDENILSDADTDKTMSEEKDSKIMIDGENEAIMICADNDKLVIICSYDDEVMGDDVEDDKIMSSAEDHKTLSGACYYDDKIVNCVGYGKITSDIDKDKIISEEENDQLMRDEGKDTVMNEGYPFLSFESRGTVHDEEDGSVATLTIDFSEEEEEEEKEYLADYKEVTDFVPTFETNAVIMSLDLESCGVYEDETGEGADRMREKEEGEEGDEDEDDIMVNSNRCGVDEDETGEGDALREDNEEGEEGDEEDMDEGEEDDIMVNDNSCGVYVNETREGVDLRLREDNEEGEEEDEEEMDEEEEDDIMVNENICGIDDDETGEGAYLKEDNEEGEDDGGEEDDIVANDIDASRNTQGSEIADDTLSVHSEDSISTRKEGKTFGDTDSFSLSCLGIYEDADIVTALSKDSVNIGKGEGRDMKHLIGDLHTFPIDRNAPFVETGSASLTTMHQVSDGLVNGDCALSHATDVQDDVLLTRLSPSLNTMAEVPDDFADAIGAMSHVTDRLDDVPLKSSNLSLNTMDEVSDGFIDEDTSISDTLNDAPFKSFNPALNTMDEVSDGFIDEDTSISDTLNDAPFKNFNPALKTLDEVSDGLVDDEFAMIQANNTLDDVPLKSVKAVLNTMDEFSDGFVDDTSIRDRMDDVPLKSFSPSLNIMDKVSDEYLLTDRDGSHPNSPERLLTEEDGNTYPPRSNNRLASDAESNTNPPNFYDRLLTDVECNTSHPKRLLTDGDSNTSHPNFYDRLVTEEDNYKRHPNSHDRLLTEDDNYTRHPNSHGGELRDADSYMNSPSFSGRLPLGISSEDAIIHQLFYQCDRQDKGQVRVSDIVSYLQRILGDQLGSDEAILCLTTILDPNRQDEEINKDGCVEGLRQWVQELKGVKTQPSSYEDIHRLESPTGQPVSLFDGRSGRRSYDSVYENCNSMPCPDSSRQASEYEQANLQLAKELAEAQSLIDVKDDELVALTRDLAQAKAKLNSVLDTSVLRAQARLEIEDLNVTVTSLTDQNEATRRTNERLEQEKQLLHNQLVRHRDQVSRLNSELASSKVENNQCNHILMETKQEASQLKDVCANLGEQLSQREEIITDLKTCLKEMSQRNEDLKDQCDELQCQVMENYRHKSTSLQCPSPVSSDESLSSVADDDEAVEDDHIQETQSKTVDMDGTHDEPAERLNYTLSIHSELKQLMIERFELPWPFSDKEIEESVEETASCVHYSNTHPGDGGNHHGENMTTRAREIDHLRENQSKPNVQVGFDDSVAVSSSQLRCLFYVIKKMKDENTRLRQLSPKPLVATPRPGSRCSHGDPEIATSGTKRQPDKVQTISLTREEALSLATSNEHLQAEVSRLHRCNVKLADDLHLAQLKAFDLEEESHNAELNLKHEKKKAADLEENLCATTLARQLDLQDIWRLVQKDVESEYPDSQDDDSADLMSLDKLKNRIKSDITSLTSKRSKTNYEPKVKLAKGATSSQAVASHQSCRSLPTAVTSYDNFPRSYLLDALSLEAQDIRVHDSQPCPKAMPYHCDERCSECRQCRTASHSLARESTATGPPLHNDATIADAFRGRINSDSSSSRSKTDIPPQGSMTCSDCLGGRSFNTRTFYQDIHTPVNGQGDNWHNSRYPSDSRKDLSLVASTFDDVFSGQHVSCVHCQHTSSPMIGDEAGSLSLPPRPNANNKAKGSVGAAAEAAAFDHGNEDCRISRCVGDCHDEMTVSYRTPRHEGHSVDQDRADGVIRGRGRGSGGRGDEISLLKGDRITTGRYAPLNTCPQCVCHSKVSPPSSRDVQPIDRASATGCQHLLGGLYGARICPPSQREGYHHASRNSDTMTIGHPNSSHHHHHQHHRRSPHQNCNICQHATDEGSSVDLSWPHFDLELDKRGPGDGGDMAPSPPPTFSSQFHDVTPPSSHSLFSPGEDLPKCSPSSIVTSNEDKTTLTLALTSVSDATEYYAPGYHGNGPSPRPTKSVHFQHLELDAMSQASFVTSPTTHQQSRPTSFTCQMKTESHDQDHGVRRQERRVQGQVEHQGQGQPIPVIRKPNPLWKSGVAKQASSSFSSFSSSMSSSSSSPALVSTSESSSFDNTWMTRSTTYPAGQEHREQLVTVPALLADWDLSPVSNTDRYIWPCDGGLQRDSSIDTSEDDTQESEDTIREAQSDVSQQDHEANAKGLGAMKQHPEAGAKGNKTKTPEDGPNTKGSTTTGVRKPSNRPPQAKPPEPSPSSSSTSSIPKSSGSSLETRASQPQSAPPLPSLTPTEGKTHPNTDPLLSKDGGVKTDPPSSKISNSAQLPPTDDGSKSKVDGLRNLSGSDPGAKANNPKTMTSAPSLTASSMASTAATRAFSTSTCSTSSLSSSMSSSSSSSSSVPRKEEGRGGATAGQGSGTGASSWNNNSLSYSHRDGSAGLKSIVPCSPPINRNAPRCPSSDDLDLAPSRLSKIRQSHLASRRREQMRNRNMKLPELAESSEIESDSFNSSTSCNTSLDTNHSPLPAHLAMPAFSPLDATSNKSGNHSNGKTESIGDGVGVHGASQIITDNNTDDNMSHGQWAGQENAVTPSLSDSMLHALGLSRRTKDSSSITNGASDKAVSVDQLSEKEIESKFISLSLAFKTDKLTLDQRVSIQERSRDLAEQNVDREIQGLRDAIEALSHSILNEDTRDAIQSINRHIEVLEQSAARVSSRAEVFGAVQQEHRMSKAMEVMVLYTENLRRVREKEEAELTEARKLLSERNTNSFFGSDFDGAHTRRSMSVTGVNPLARPMRRRSEVVLPKVLGGIGGPMIPTSSMENVSPFLLEHLGQSASVLSQLDSEEDARARFQSAIASTSMQNAVTSTMKRASLEKGKGGQLPSLSSSISSSSSSAPPSATVTSNTSPPTLTVTEAVKEEPDVSTKNSDSLPEPPKDSKDSPSVLSKDENAYRKGFEEGYKAKLSQQLTDLRDQQNSISQNIEDVMDKVDQAQISHQEQLARPSRIQFAINVLVQLGVYLINYNYMENKKLIRNIAGVLFVLFAILAVFLSPPISTVDVQHFSKPPQ